MNAKLVVTVALLSFVVVSVGTMFVRENSEDNDAASAIAIPAASSNATSPIEADGVIVYYFHGNMRCPTCRRIEAYTQEAVEKKFGDELASGEIVWQALNFEIPENAHFVDDYQLVASTVVVAERRGGQQVAWENLNRVWQLVGDQTAFVAYIQDRVHAHLAEGTHQ